MTKIIKNDGSETEDFKEILEEAKTYYTKLYRRPTNELTNDIKASLDSLPKLSEGEANLLSGEITLAELTSVFKNAKSNKSPGTDGYTAEFLKCFWPELGHLVVKSINDGFNLGDMSATQKEGLIILLPKGEKTKTLLKNWRPITLLNVIYKLASGAIANRLKKVLTRLIHPDQRGFLAGRFTGDNIRLVYDVLDHSMRHQQRGLLLLIDFEKAFDSISWEFVHDVLRIFKFSENFSK
ncbi:reverse transcriptase [Elysia marginata]|uniref:Reverse transcriptase n=1 Tax=Elysia marginata TaxID=1093978 RepID=A0AAV4EFI2_9GAST|nr:reverse transcriptase [Elysia marginata]